MQKGSVTLVVFAAAALAAVMTPSPWWAGSLLRLPMLDAPAEPAADPPAAAPPAGPVVRSASARLADAVSAAYRAAAPRPLSPERTALRDRIREARAELDVPTAPRLGRPCVARSGPTCTRRALDRYLDALTATGLGLASQPARFSLLGDSLVMSDGVTSGLRAAVGPLFGDGGHGFLYPGHPERVPAAHGLNVSVSDAWSVRTIVRGPSGNGLLGFGGAAFEATDGPTFAVRDNAGDPLATRLGVLWLPRTGTVGLRVAAGRERLVWDDPVERGSSTLSWLDLPAGTANIRVGGFAPGSLYFGVILENRAGVVFDSVGLVSADVDRLTRIDAEHWDAQLRLRDPDVVALMYGANADLEHFSPARYREEVVPVLQRVTSAEPARDCLVISIVTRGTWAEGTPVQPPAVGELARAQADAALEAGCAFLDLHEAAGGDDALRRWYRASPRLLGSDLAHPTREGYAQIAAWVAAALLDALDEHVADSPPDPASTP